MYVRPQTHKQKQDNKRFHLHVCIFVTGSDISANNFSCNTLILGSLAAPGSECPSACPLWAELTTACAFRCIRSRVVGNKSIPMGAGSPTDYTKPRQIIYSPDRLNKAPTDNTTPPKDYRNLQKDFTKPLSIKQKPQNIKQAPNILNKSTNNY